MNDAWPTSIRYRLGTAANWLLFLLGVWLLAQGGGPNGFPPALSWAIALLLTLSVAAQMVAAYRLIVRQDEFIRAITAKRMIAAGGVTLTVAVFAGLAGQFLGLPPLPMWLVYPFFWGAFGMVTPLIGSSRP